MSQVSFADGEYVGKRKKTGREVFLDEMEVVVPWKALLGLIEPHYPVAGRGRRPYPLESMLRVHLMQNWFALSDPAMEEALYEIASLRAFGRLSLGEPIPDETTILNFRHLLEANDLAEDILKTVNAHLARKGLLLKRGSIVDATIIAEAPRMAPHIPRMVAHIEADLGLPAGRVNVKATTGEQMGFVGREEGVAALAIATVDRT